MGDLAPAHFADWCGRRLRGLSAESVHRELSSLSAVCQVAVQDWGRLRDNPVRAIRKPERAKPRDRLPTEDETARLLLVLGYERDLPPVSTSARVGAAWGRGEEAWIVDRHILWGDTLQEAVWRELDAYMVEPLRHQSGVPMRVTAYSVDSGDGTRQHMAYDYVRKRQALGAMAIKGANMLGAPELATPKMAEIDVGGRKVKNGVLLWMVGVHRIKTALYARLAVATPGRNCIHFGSWLPDEFYTQLTAEKLVPRRVAGRMVKRWELPNGARNEAWDLLVYNYATALRIGINRWGEPRWDAIEQAFRQGDLLATPSHDGAEDGASESIEVVDVEAVHTVEAPPTPSATVTTPAAPRPQRRTARSSYLQR
ncbi:terminase gpA endonuclease subunit [Chitinibacteraceae bacterium HSL-7]